MRVVPALEHAQTKYFRREEYLPVNTIVELDDREFRVDSVNFEQGAVSLQDMTLAKEARYPIFRTEPLEYIRHLYEQADVSMKEAVETTVFTALHNAGVAYEDFSPEQMDVIYSVAESGGELEELLNPDFPPEQMQLIADVQNRTDAISRAAAEEALEPLTQQPMTPAEVNHARRQHNLPLDSGAIELPAQPKQEPMNFRITDDDLGVGGPKTKYKANVEAIRLLKTLDAEQRQATAEEQEILSRYVGWGGIPQAFDESNAEWSKEYAELQSLLTADEYNMYSRDIAKKIRAALETNWKNGKATCTNVPFGYVWNKKGGQRWEIDPEAAPCVKKVFELALSGRNTTQIAYGMNELNLPTPGLYAKRKNLLMGSNPIIAPDSEMLWNAAIVWRILRRYEYTGALVMGRRKKIDVNTTSVRTLPEDKWIIAENAHAAIVTKDEYYQAQKAIRNVTPIQYKVGDEFALKGKICCGNCNRQLRHERQYGEMVFYCGYKRSAGKFSKCYGGYYREYSVNAKVARAIKTVFYALDVVNQGMQEKQSITVRCVDIEDLEKQAEAIRVEQIKLYESYADGVLRRDVYIEKKKTLSEKLAALQDSIRTEKEEQECADELDEEIRALTKQASEKTYIGGLTKECVDAFVSMVYLYDDQTMKIEFNCEDVIRRALEKYGA